MSSTRELDAFVLPAGIRVEALRFSSYDDSGVDVRYVDASPGWLVELGEALARSRETLLGRTAGSIAGTLGAVGQRFLDHADPLRAEALELLPDTAGLSPAMAVAVLDGMAADWTADRLLGLVRAELEDEGVLDGFVPAGAASGGAAPAGAPPPLVMAVGSRLSVQIVAGSVPGVAVTALLRALLVKSPSLVKPGRGDVVLPVLFARALRDADPALADSLAVAYWPGGDRERDEAAMTGAGVVTAYGSDDTVGKLRRLAPVTSRFVGYHHRVSVGIVGRLAVSGDRLSETAAEVAEAVSYFDQRGCVSPQIVFVEADPEEARELGKALADHLARTERRLPSGALGRVEAGALHQLRGTAELMAAEGVTVLHGGEAPWTVIVESGEHALEGSAGRMVRVRPVSDAADVPEILTPWAPHLQTVGVAGLGPRLHDVARALARAGASRVVPFSSVAFPPPWWHHDGGGPLRDLIRWVDLVEAG